MQIVDRLSGAVETGSRRLRERVRVVDHVWSAYERYDCAYAGRLAAAIAYYGFFAAFALAALLFSVVGRLLERNSSVVVDVQAYLSANLPRVTVETLTAAADEVGLLALVALVIAGVGWVEALRSSQRAVWGLEQQPGNFAVRWLVDLAVLFGLGITLTVSVAISAGVQDLLLDLAADSPLRVLLRVTGPLLAIGVDLVFAAALLSGVPRLRMPLRRLLPAALLIAVGLGLLKTAGRWYLGRTLHNPAYSVAAGAVGLLIFMYLLNQVILFAAALAATSPHGIVVDLAAGVRRRRPVEPAAVAAAELAGRSGAGSPAPPEAAGVEVAADSECAGAPPPPNDVSTAPSRE